MDIKLSDIACLLQQKHANRCIKELFDPEVETIESGSIQDAACYYGVSEEHLIDLTKYAFLERDIKVEEIEDR